MGKKDYITAEGLVADNCGHDNYRVALDNGITILATLSGRIRQHHIRIMVGDRVEIELSPYDLSRGRISRRFNVKQRNNNQKLQSNYGKKTS